MSDIDKSHLFELFRAVAKQFLERGIHANEPASGIDQRHAYGRVFQNHAELCFTPAQGLFRALAVGDIHVDADHPDWLTGFVIKHSTSRHQPANLTIVAAANAELVMRLTNFEYLLKITHRRVQILGDHHRLPIFEPAREAARM